MKPALRHALVVVGLLAAAGRGHAEPKSQSPGRPKLVVLVVVDQMRADYVDRYGASWKAGFRRLLAGGAHLTMARYPNLNTFTCTGHATVSTGATPRTHGMIQNTWYDRRLKKVVACTHDPDTKLVFHAGHGPSPPHGGESARNLVVPALADEMQSQLHPRPRIASFSLKARSAITLGGHKPDVALWKVGTTWVTSSAFATATPPWVTNLVGTGPPAGRFRGAEPDEILGRLAGSAIVELKLGQRAAPDLLAIGFSDTDTVGHKFGPRSREVQDVLARLDVTLGRLLDALDAAVGQDRYVVALTSDHGVADIAEQAKAEGADAGRIDSSRIEQQANQAVAAELGPGTYVAEVQGNDIYLAPGVSERLAAKTGAMDRVLARVRVTPGVAAAFAAAEIRGRSAATHEDPLRRAAALAYYPGRSGDILVSAKRGWTLGATLPANHGSVHDYDQRVPIVFFGNGIKPGRYDQAATPADIAPTLAKLVGVKMPKADGRALTFLFRTPP